MTPPESPIRRRSENFKGPDCRPKPPVRRRKKKFSSEDNTKSSQDGTNRNSTDVGSIRRSISEDFVTVDPSSAVREREKKWTWREGLRPTGQIFNKENSAKMT